MKIFLRNNLWSVLWGFLILVLTLMPGYFLPRVPVWVDKYSPDKLVHLFIFGVFGFLLVRGFRKPGTPAVIMNIPFVWALLVSAFIGGATELAQGWLIPLRTASWYDFLADVAGALAGISVIGLHRYLKRE